MKIAHVKKLDKKIGTLEELSEWLSDIVSEYQEKYDNMSEKSQEGEKGEKLTEEIDKLETIQNSVDELRDNIVDLTGDYADQIS